MHWSSYPVPLGTGEPNGIGCTRSLHTVLNLLLFDRPPPSADAPSVDARRDSTALHTLQWPHQRPSSSPTHPSRPSTSRGGHCLRIYPTNMYITYLLESKLRGLTGHKKRHSAEASHARPHARTAVLPPSGPPVQAQRPALRPLPPSQPPPRPHYRRLRPLQPRPQRGQRPYGGRGQPARSPRHQRRQRPSCWRGGQWWRPLARPARSWASRTRCWPSRRACGGCTIDEKKRGVREHRLTRSTRARRGLHACSWRPGPRAGRRGQRRAAHQWVPRQISTRKSLLVLSAPSRRRTGRRVCKHGRRTRWTHHQTHEILNLRCGCMVRDGRAVGPPGALSG